MKIIYSRWDEGAGRWRNKTIDGGNLSYVCALEDHSKCTHSAVNEEVYTNPVALRNTRIQSVLFTPNQCVVRLVPA